MTMLAAAAVAVLLGALVRGYTGFGASMFWVASLALIYPPSSVVPTVLLLEVLASLVLVPAVWREVDWHRMRWMLLASVLTMPLGVALLQVLPARPMRVVVALVILIGALAMACGIRTAGRPGTRTALAAGSVSGVVNGSTGLGGPPAVLLYFSGTESNAVGRATLIAYFLGTDAAGFAMMAGSGLVDVRVLAHSALFAPLALVGITVGQRTFRRTDGRSFRAVVTVVLLVLSVATLVRAAVAG
jgi:uncharacterized protein